MKYVSAAIKILFLIALIGVGFLIYNTCVGADIISVIDKTLPETSAAPFEIPTVTRIYYARHAVLNEDGSVTMTNWYVKENNKWVFYEGSETLLPVLQPRITRR